MTKVVGFKGPLEARWWVDLSAPLQFLHDAGGLAIVPQSSLSHHVGSAVDVVQELTWSRETHPGRLAQHAHQRLR